MSAGGPGKSRFPHCNSFLLHGDRTGEHRLGIRPMRPPDRRFADGTILDIGPIQLQAIHAPDHLIDHYCFMELGSKTLFPIDIAFTGFGPWYGLTKAIHLKYEMSASVGAKNLPSLILVHPHQKDKIGQIRKACGINHLKPVRQTGRSRPAFHPPSWF